MDINNAETKIDKVDSFLTKLKIVLKKHWGILLIILVSYVFYLLLTTNTEGVEEEVFIEYVEPYQEEYNELEEEPYIVDEYFEMDEYGDTLIIQVWSDGIETIAE